MEKIPKQQPNNLIKVVLFGPESTGKTTLSKQLAEHYKTAWVPEFARDYLQKKWDNEQKICEKKDLLPIAIGQMNLENKRSQKANKVLICDTNLLETKVYSEQYFNGFSPNELKKASINNKYDRYFLTYIDTPWVKDDLRDKPMHREEMFTAFENALKQHNCPYTLLTGNEKTRFKKAVTIIDQLIEKQSKPKSEIE